MTARFTKAYIEIGSACNIRCGFCPELRRPKDLMGRELFRRVAAEAAPLVEHAFLHLMGEPLAHPLFAEFVGICAEAALPAHVATNGTLLSEDKVEALLHPVVRQVSFSLHSLEAGAPGEETEHWRRIAAFCRRAMAERPDLFINLRLWNLSSPGGSPDAKHLERIRSAFGADMSGPVDVRSRKGRRIKGRLCLHLDTRFEWPSLSAPTVSERGTCRGLGDQFGVLCDGTVVPCCLDSEGSVPLGNVARSPLADILSGSRARAMRAGFAEGRREEELCRRCSYSSRFQVKGPARLGLLDAGLRR
ncbi:MAG: SPASM domain-containing protein [Elusimicrobia bacterium]|nr:SPASM domain-containing protein [Elusimicrobiota bacterium]